MQVLIKKRKLLPVTFDSGAILFTVLGIIIIALAIFVFIRIKSNKKDENK